MPNFNIEDFKAKLRTGLLRNNKFKMQVGWINGMAGTPFFETSKDLEFYCESVDIPGAILQTNDVKRYGYGPMEKKPYMPAFADCRAVIRSDQEGKIFSFFRQWQALAVNYQMGARNGTSQAITDKNGWTNPNPGIGGAAKQLLTPYELGYKKNYATTVEIYMYSDDGKFQSGIILRDAYPVLTADMPLAWAQTKSYAQLPVAFSFVDMSFFSEKSD